MDMGVRMWPCQMTMDLYGLTGDDFIDGLQASVGAASFIDWRPSPDITMFI